VPVDCFRQSVLIVDDDHATRRLLEVLLDGAGFGTDQAEDGVEAASKLRRGGYDVLVLDLLMPRMNGFELLRELRSFDPKMVSRTIILTAAADQTLMHFDPGSVFAVLRKPFDIRDFLAIVRKCAGSRVAGARDTIRLRELRPA
jgi:DNA-binding response OmpR family regulator